MAFPMWWLLIFLAASLALCFVWNWWRSLALKSSVWTMMPILSLTVTCENPPCPSLRTFRPSFSPLRCLPEPCSSLECCNNYTETVSPFTFWLLSFANSQFLVITKSVPLAGRLKAEFSSGEGGRTVMIGWASQQGKSVCPDRLLSREPPCFHGTVTYLTIISLSPPYFPGGATPASSPDSHLGPLCLLFSSKKLSLPLSPKTLPLFSPPFLSALVLLSFYQLWVPVQALWVSSAYFEPCSTSYFSFTVSFLNSPTPLKVKVKVKSLSRVWLLATPWTVAHQAPPSMGFSRQESWSGLSVPSPGDLLDPGIEPTSPALRADALTSEPWGKPHLLLYLRKYLFL